MTETFVRLTQYGCDTPCNDLSPEHDTLPNLLRQVWREITDLYADHDNVCVGRWRGQLGAIIGVDYDKDRAPTPEDAELGLPLFTTYPEVDFRILGEGHGFYGTGEFCAFVPRGSFHLLRPVSEAIADIMYR